MKGSGPGAGGAAAAADHRIARYLLDRQATSAEHAVRFSPESALDARRLRKLTQQGVVREAGPELLFLDETAWARLKKNRIILVTILLAITACIMAAILLFA
jgi:uridylate kinase